MTKLSRIFVINEKILQEEQMKNTLKIVLKMLNVRFCFEKGKEGRKAIRPQKHNHNVVPVFSSCASVDKTK